MTTPIPIAKFQVEAERILLGILMGSPRLAESCGVVPSDLCPERGHPEILGAILSVFEKRDTADPVLVTDELVRCDQLSRIGTEDHRGGVYLIELVEAGRSPGTAGYYAQIVREATARRSLYDIGTQLVRTATTQGDLDVVLDNAAELALTLGLIVDTPIEGDTPIPGLSMIEEFVDEPSPPHTWVIPGLVERSDRVMIIATEGAGKSVLARQLCTLLAAGRHPFAPRQQIFPRRTLLIDLENPPDLVRRGLRDMVGRIREDGLDLGDRAWRWNRPGGMDLRSQGDRQLLTRVIEMVRPDLIAIGPLYKASLPRPGDTYEVAAAETARAFDHFRERYGVAFWIEHHAPKSTGPDGQRNNPIGSSYWLRWPEFGLALEWAGGDETNVFLLKRFRGDRDERFWPDKLVKRAGRYPWTPDWDDDEAKNGLFLACEDEQADLIRLAREAREALEAGSPTTTVTNEVDHATEMGHQPTSAPRHGPGGAGSVPGDAPFSTNGSRGSSGSSPRTGSGAPWQERYTPSDVERDDDTGVTPENGETEGPVTEPGEGGQGYDDDFHF